MDHGLTMFGYMYIYICVEHVWDIFVISLGNVYGMFGTCVGDICNMVGAFFRACFGKVSAVFAACVGDGMLEMNNTSRQQTPGAKSLPACPRGAAPQDSVGV